jgi:acyl-CoA thioesterase I
VGDHDHGSAFFAVQGQDEVEDQAAGGAIQVAGRLVGQKDGRSQSEGAGQGDALLLAAGELHGIMVEAASEADAVEQFAGAFGSVTCPRGQATRQFHGQEHVFLGGERGDEVIRLEDEPDFAAAHLRHAVFVEVGDVFAIQDHLARSGGIEAGEEAEQGALAAARGSHDGGELAARDIEIDAFEDVHPVSAGGNGFSKSADLDQTFIMTSRMRRFWWMALLAVAWGCQQKKEPTGQSGPATAAQAPAVKQAPMPADPRPVIACFGDSLTAGFGLETGQSFPDLLQADLDRRGYHYRVANMGVSGDTSQDGLARLPMALEEKPAIALVELGANDGLRGQPIETTESNLAQIVEALQKGGARVVLAGITLPPNYGPEYIRRFEAMYRELAARYKLKLIPFLLEGVGGHADLMQRDGLHPNAEGARIVEATVLQAILPMVGK